jgi:hypothetical protein
MCVEVIARSGETVTASMQAYRGEQFHGSRELA